MGEARQFKFSVQTDTNEYYYMHDRLPANEYVQGHVTFNFWKITDNILEMVQNADIVAIEIICGL